GIGRQVFRFDVPFGTAPPRRPRLAPTPDVAVVGPYTVRFDSLHLAAGSMTMLNVRITKDGKPANDLHPYLGGAAHAVFINAGDYAYLHVHPMAAGDMSSMSAMGAASEGGEMRDLPPSAKVSPQMMLHVTAPAAGTYKLWLQFRGGSALYVAPFVLTAS
ncbi:MAG TPA: hypothetical protein VKG44_03925, partial [Candidatus Baltobacteraceae bacterium]|nr:hypothetical protein [Candidatus Baltobacteraceae bacterium]